MQANVELVRAIYDRFRPGNEAAALALIDPGIEIRERPDAPDPQVYRGHEGVLRALDTSRATFDDLDLSAEEFLDAGDHVIVVVRFSGKGRGSGVPIDERVAHVWTVREGKAVRMDVHSGREEALRAVSSGMSSGLRER